MKENFDYVVYPAGASTWNIKYEMFLWKVISNVFQNQYAECPFLLARSPDRCIILRWQERLNYEAPCQKKWVECPYLPLWPLSFARQEEVVALGGTYEIANVWPTDLGETILTGEDTVVGRESASVFWREACVYRPRHLGSRLCSLYTPTWHVLWFVAVYHPSTTVLSIENLIQYALVPPLFKYLLFKAFV